MNREDAKTGRIKPFLLLLRAFPPSLLIPAAPRLHDSAFVMLLLVFMMDFAKIALATDRVRPCKKPETWNIGGFITVSVVLGVAMIRWRVPTALA